MWNLIDIRLTSTLCYVVTQHQNSFLAAIQEARYNEILREGQIVSSSLSGPMQKVPQKDYFHYHKNDYLLSCIFLQGLKTRFM